MPGNYLVICDLCGFTKRIRETRKTWEGLLVCYPECWDRKHPQETIESKRDKMSVPIARPDAKTQTRETTLSVAASKGAITVTVTDVSNMSDLDGIGIVQDDGATHWTFISGDPVGSVVTLNDFLWGDAASGNAVYMSDATGDNFGTTVSASDL